MQPPRLFIVATEVAGLFLLAALVDISAAQAGQIYTHSPLALRGGPDDGFAITDNVDSGTQIDVLWCNGGSSWCLVQHETGQGWAPITSLRADGLPSPSAPRSRLKGDDDDTSNGSGRKPGHSTGISAGAEDSGRGSNGGGNFGNGSGHGNSGGNGNAGAGNSGNGGNNGAGNGNAGDHGSDNGHGNGNSDHGGFGASLSVGGGIGVSISSRLGSVGLGGR